MAMILKFLDIQWIKHKMIISLNLHSD